MALKATKTGCKQMTKQWKKENVFNGVGVGGTPPNKHKLTVFFKDCTASLQGKDSLLAVLRL